MIRIPGPFQKYAYNVAILSERLPAVEGRVITQSMNSADFLFGHHGRPVSLLRDNILEFMGRDTWFRRVLLAQDNFKLEDNSTEPKTPHGWRAIVAKTCREHNLTEEQVQAVWHYFTHKLTIVVGPPGSGKSLLVKVLLNLEKQFQKRFWVCTASNAACDVLAEMFAESQGTKHPHFYYRLYQMFQERLAADDNEERRKVMSLGHTIRTRMDTGVGNEMRWETEAADLRRLDSIMQGKANLRDDEEPCLPKIQMHHVDAAKGIFSTDAVTVSPLLRRYIPNALVFDEASQMLEARTLFALIRSAKGRQLERLLLIGDRHQLPTLIKADRNVFAQTCKMSMFERLIRAGTPHIQFTEQWRMHPHISSIVNGPIYGGSFRDGTTTTTRPAVAQFQAFVRAQFGASRQALPTDTSVVVISPSKSDKYHWGSQQAIGSTSRFNLQTAAMVFKQVHWLVQDGRFAASDIMVTSFFPVQVSLLEALFEGDPQFADLTLATVDGCQGKEATVVVVDCVTLGGGVGEPMGFLGGEKHRFNVAMSRAMAGLIVVCHEDFTKGTRSKGPWTTFLEVARQKGRILGDRLFHGDWPNPAMAQKFDEVTGEFMKRAVNSY